MTDSEQDDLDRWLASIRGEINSWTRPSGGTMFEARVWQDGKVLRFLNEDRYHAIAALKVAFTA